MSAEKCNSSYSFFFCWIEGNSFRGKDLNYTRQGVVYTGYFNGFTNKQIDRESLQEKISKLTKSHNLISFALPRPKDGSEGVCVIWMRNCQTKTHARVFLSKHIQNNFQLNCPVHADAK